VWCDRLLFSFSFTTHLIACFYWLLIKDKERDVSDHCEQHLCPWVLCASANLDQFGHKFSRSLYHALFMILGNDTSPHAPDEFAFSYTVFLIGMFVNSVIIGTLATTIANLNQQAAAKQDHFKRLNSSLSYHSVSSSVRQRARFFLATSSWITCIPVAPLTRRAFSTTCRPPYKRASRWRRRRR
jgi:hypothetical protein